MLDISIIIVNYNVKEFLQNLLNSIAKASRNCQTELIIVDNASDDGSVEFICDKFPEVKLIVNKKNLGFGKANNIGLAQAKGKYILLINPDSIVREDTLDKMIEFFEKTAEAGLAGCKILNPDGTLQLACRRSFPGPWTSFCKVTGLSTLFPKSKIFARYNLTYLDENQTYEVDAISGSFMMIRREVYEKVGGFDDDFFMYGEDLDLCYRIQKAGYKVYYVHNTQIIHYKGESTKRSNLDETKVFYDAMKLFVKKHLSSSFLVEFILRSAITFRKFFAFLGRRRFFITSIIFDFIFFNITIFAAEKFYTLIKEWQGFPDFSMPIIYSVPAILHITCGALLGVYRKDSLSILKNFGAIFISFFVISSLTYFFNQFAYSRAVILLTYLFLIVTLTSWRIFIKLFFKVGLNEFELTGKRTLIVGINNPVVQIANKLRSRHTDYYNVIGLIGLSQRDIGKNISGYEVVGSIENVRKIVRNKKINEIIFPPGDLSYNQIMSVVSSCQNESVEFKLIGSNLDFLVGKTSVSILDDIPLIEIRHNISDPLLKFIKASFDYLMALFVLFFIYPFIYLAAKLNMKNSDFKNFILKVPTIFTGRISFVGPKNPDSNNKIFLGKKGLTGLWYIENLEGGDYEKLDIFYAKNQNIWLDLGILGRTLNKMWSS